jgi:hypothetical protein
MDGSLTVALELAFSFSLAVVTWSAGLIAFSSTFLAPAYREGIGKRTLLVLLLTGFSLSIVAGVFCLLSIIGHLAAAGPAPIAMPGLVPASARIQLVLFFVALILWVVLAFKRMTSKPTEAASTAPGRGSRRARRRRKMRTSNVADSG